MHAINRESIVKSKLPPGAEVATQFNAVALSAGVELLSRRGSPVALRVDPEARGATVARHGIAPDDRITVFAPGAAKRMSLAIVPGRRGV